MIVLLDFSENYSFLVQYAVEDAVEIIANAHVIPLHCTTIRTDLAGVQASGLLATGCDTISCCTHIPNQDNWACQDHCTTYKLKSTISVSWQLAIGLKNFKNFSNGSVECQLNEIFASSLGKSVSDRIGSTMKWEVARQWPPRLLGWRFGVAVTRWSRSTQLLYIEPG